MEGIVSQSDSAASIDATSFMQLRWDQIQTPYFRVLTGAFSVETLQAFCAAVRWAFEQYHDYSYRFPNRLESGARACIDATQQVLEISNARGGEIVGDPEALVNVISALERHLQRFQQEVKYSKRRSGRLSTAA